MSSEIYYDRAFIRVDDRYIPIVKHKEAPLIVFKISLTTLASRLCRRWLNIIPFALSKHTITVIDSPPSSFHRCSQTQINSMSMNIIADNRENYN